MKYILNKTKLGPRKKIEKKLVRNQILTPFFRMGNCGKNDGIGGDFCREKKEN